MLVRLLLIDVLRSCCWYIKTQTAFAKHTKPIWIEFSVLFFFSTPESFIAGQRRSRANLSLAQFHCYCKWNEIKNWFWSLFINVIITNLRKEMAEREKKMASAPRLFASPKSSFRSFKFLFDVARSAILLTLELKRQHFPPSMTP